MEETEKTIYLDKIYVTTDNGQTYTPYKIKWPDVDWGSAHKDDE